MGHAASERQLITRFSAALRERTIAVIASIRIFLDHGVARSDEPLKNVTHLESFVDDTVLIEFDKSANPATLVVREQGKEEELTILERGPNRVRFRWTPPPPNHVKIIVIEGALQS